MKQIQITAYTFEELSDRAKDNVRSRLTADYPWEYDSRDSLLAYCKHFGVTLKEWQTSPADFTTDADNSNFRGLRWSEVKKLKDHCPTGYCLDVEGFNAFVDAFREKGAKRAFEDGLYAMLYAIEKDMYYQASDEALAETCEANGYLFDEYGNILPADEREK